MGSIPVHGYPGYGLRLGECRTAEMARWAAITLLAQRRGLHGRAYHVGDGRKDRLSSKPPIRLGVTAAPNRMGTPIWCLRLRANSITRRGCIKIAPHLYTAVAHEVERWTYNPQVDGSIPSGSTNSPWTPWPWRRSPDG